MAEHYTRNTVSADAWCGKCNRRTQHRIDGVRKGPCLVCIARLEENAAKPKPAPAAEQAEMFTSGGAQR